MTDETIKLLLSASEVTLLAVALVAMAYFLSKGRGKATAAEAETERKQQENEGKLIDAVSKTADAFSKIETSIAKMVDIQNDTVEWHKRHEQGLNALRTDAKTRSELDGQAIDEFRNENRVAQGKTQESIEALIKSIDALTQKIEADLQKRHDCADVNETVAELKKQIDRLTTLEVKAVSKVTIDNVQPPAQENAA